MKTDAHNLKERLQFGHISYSRFTDKCPEHDRGTVIIDDDNIDRVIKDYPHIPRVYRMHEGIRHFFGERYFFAEEKLDGYNVRIIRIGEDILGLTRGGFICPFTTEWLGYWRSIYRLDEFFDHNPDMIICAEFVGDNPYNSKRDSLLPPGLSFFCFDIMRNDGKLMDVESRYRIFDELDLPGVRSYGKFNADDSEKLKEIMLDLNRRGREGLIFKGVNGNSSVKFVTAESDLNDIEKTLEFFYDIEPGFYTNRLMRISLFVRDFGLDMDIYKGRIGECVLKGYSFIENYSGSFETFTIYMHSIENWKFLKKLIITHKDIVHDGTETAVIGGVKLHKIVFRRKHRKSTERFHFILGGHEE